METIKCYRFVKDDLSSENGQMTWEIGEWNKVSGKITCCSNGLHASLTPRDSMRNVYGQRWFISEARGEIDKLDSKFAAREMRIIQEIPTEVLQNSPSGALKIVLNTMKKDSQKTSECETVSRPRKTTFLEKSRSMS